MDLILILMLIGTGYMLGKIHAYWDISKILRDIADKQGIDIEKELKKLSSEEVEEKLVYKLQVESHGDMLYLFDHDTNEFICQGSNIQELAKLAKDYKKVMYAAVRYNDKVFSFKDGISTEIRV